MKGRKDRKGRNGSRDRIEHGEGKRSNQHKGSSLIGSESDGGGKGGKGGPAAESTSETPSTPLLLLSATERAVHTDGTFRFCERSNGSRKMGSPAGAHTHLYIQPLLRANI